MNVSAYPEQEPAVSARIAGEGFLKTDAEGILTFLRNTRESVHLHGVQDSALAHVVARGLPLLRKPMVLIASNEAEAEQYFETVCFFAGQDSQRPDVAHPKSLVLSLSHGPQSPVSGENGSHCQAA